MNLSPTTMCVSSTWGGGRETRRGVPHDLEHRIRNNGEGGATQAEFQRLQMTLRWIHNSVPFYRKAWGEVDLEPGDIKSLDDLHRVPFTNKEHFREAYPYGLFAVPMEQVVRIHSSTGTSAKPVVVGYTRGDLNTWAELCARVAVAGGARAHD